MIRTGRDAPGLARVPSCRPRPIRTHALPRQEARAEGVRPASLYRCWRTLFTSKTGYPKASQIIAVKASEDCQRLEIDDGQSMAFDRDQSFVAHASEHSADVRSAETEHICDQLL